MATGVVYKSQHRLTLSVTGGGQFGPPLGKTRFSHTFCPKHGPPLFDFLSLVICEL